MILIRQLPASRQTLKSKCQFAVPLSDSNQWDQGAAGPLDSELAAEVCVSAARRAKGVIIGAKDTMRSTGSQLPASVARVRRNRFLPRERPTLGYRGSQPVLQSASHLALSCSHPQPTSLDSNTMDDIAGQRASNRRSVKMAVVPVCSTELGYVTGVDEEQTKFFVQLCKFTNAELLQHNKQINDFCKNLATRRKEMKVPNCIAPKVGDVLCARYAIDNNWYRIVVNSSDEADRECKVYFVDYGNVETIAFDDLLEIDSADLPAVERAPFGLYCKLKSSEKYPNKDKLLQALSDEYIMIKPLEQVDYNLWCVDIPNVAYNQSLLGTLQQTNKGA